MITGTELREAFIWEALSAVGLEAGNPKTRAAFEQLLGPVPGGGRWDLDRPFRMWRDKVTGKWRTEGISTCAMVAVGLMRRMQPDAPAVMAPYHAGDGLEDLIRFAKECGAWQEPVRGSDLRPEGGDIIQVVDPMHVLAGVRWNGDLLTSVDGGQRGLKGLQAVKQCERLWHYDDDGDPWLDARPVRGWVVLDLLRFNMATLEPMTR